MALKDEVEEFISSVFREVWSTSNGITVPDISDVPAKNKGVKIKAAVLYADINGSTSMVDNYDSSFAAEIYKAYLYSAGRIIRNQGGTITAYDGDRIMAVFVGDSKRTSAVKAAMKINYVVSEVINKRDYVKNKRFSLNHVIGIDVSDILVAKIGVRADNDLVWVGRAANYAAKLTDGGTGYSIRITKDVYDEIHESVKFNSDKTLNMWSIENNTFKGLKIYGSNWWWSI